MNTYALIALALFIEAVINTLKWAIRGEYNLWRIGAIALGVLVALAYKVDLLAIAGVEPAYAWLGWVGSVLTGLVLSRGANFVADFTKVLESLHAGEAEDLGELLETSLGRHSETAGGEIL